MHQPRAEKEPAPVMAAQAVVNGLREWKSICALRDGKEWGGINLILYKMKKIILMSIIAFLLASSSFAGAVITIKAEIGKKSQPNCPGFGLCNISISIGVTPNDGMVNGNLSVENSTETMTLGLSEKDILSNQPDKIVYFKGKTSVIFTEDFILSSEINSAAKAIKPLVIKRGEYPLTYKNGMYYIEIPM